MFLNLKVKCNFGEVKLCHKRKITEIRSIRRHKGMGELFLFYVPQQRKRDKETEKVEREPKKNSKGRVEKETGT